MDHIIKIISDVDTRTKDWFLVDMPKSIFGLIFAYILWIKVLAPEYMKNRKPYDVKIIVNLYNIFQIFACLYLVIQFIAYGAVDANVLKCKSLDASLSSDALSMAKVVWLAFLLKAVDLIETVLFSLRKKWNQISFLHVYHHIVTFALMWLAARYHPGGYYSQILCGNNLVHFFMYLYYTFAANASNESRKRLIILKKMVTIIQLIQFVTFIWWGMQSFYVDGCSSERNISYILLPYFISLFYLFSSFYIKTYHGKIRKS